ncbi:hypothetical protein RJ641_015966 [Dillenia turbinata]|uniref:GRIP domain-containing protein n=1 Tax=Dillenia turbinata TaxID=194707 RepID=A0AAN8UZY9_9MAGN
MWSSIANLKENLNRIALDVHDEDDDELEIYNSTPPPLKDDSPSISDRRSSHRFAHSKSSSFSQSPTTNGVDSPYDREVPLSKELANVVCKLEIDIPIITAPKIEHYKAEIKRLQESEAGSKALSVNYAALLKEKEDQLSRLFLENSSLKQNLNAANAMLSTTKNESPRSSTSGPNVLKGSGELSHSRNYKVTNQGKIRSAGNQIHNSVVSKQDGLSNGIAHVNQSDVTQGRIQVKYEKELAALSEENGRSKAALQATHEAQLKELRMELNKEREQLATMQSKLQEEYKFKGALQEELNSLKMDRDKTSTEVKKLYVELDEKKSEVRRLQMELRRREDEDAADKAENLKLVIETLEKENSVLKMKMEELDASLGRGKALTRGSSLDASGVLDKGDAPRSFPEKEEMELRLQKLEKDMKEACRQRDKALQELNRLKQHLLEKESEEAEKMDEDGRVIEELQKTTEYQNAKIVELELALNQAIATRKEVEMNNNNEAQKSREIINDLNKKLADCISTIDAKNVELLNLQTALGQYYAEFEAKEHLEGDLAQAREESTNLSGLLKDAKQQIGMVQHEKEEILGKLSQAERMVVEGKNRVNKLEEDNEKLRRAIDQSMTRLNRMSMDSDYLVDRRIVIKLLVTYFQRNHSKEVLDLMVRMLGFSDEDKQRIGVAQQGSGKGVVRGVLGLPGRLVGGILGGTSAEAQANAASDNQSFADLWVDFLLKETEERERREAGEVSGASKDLPARSPSSSGSSVTQVPDHRRSPIASTSNISRLNASAYQSPSPQSSRGSLYQSEHSDSEFSTVPLRSSDSSSRISRLLPKY